MNTIYRKFSAPLIFDGNQFLLDPHVLITRANGEVVDLLPEHLAGEGVEKLSGTICPGFVNTHCHLELSHLYHQIPEKTGMVNFLLAVIQQRTCFPELEIDAMHSAQSAMWEAGISGVGDICNTNRSIPVKKLGKIRYHHFLELVGLNPTDAREKQAAMENLALAFLTNFPENTVSLSPHAPYSVSPALFHEIISGKYASILSMHNQESAEEDAFFKTGQGDFNRLLSTLNISPSFFSFTGNSSLVSCWPYLSHASRVLLVHNVTTHKADLDFVKQFQDGKPLPFYCFCPNANLYIGNGLPAINLFYNYGCSITIGTDSLASNHKLCMLGELKTIHQHFSSIPVGDLLKWATSNGAQALNMQEQLGQFSPGKQPGVLLLQGVDNLAIAETASVQRLL